MSERNIIMYGQPTIDGEYQPIPAPGTVWTGETRTTPEALAAFGIGPSPRRELVIANEDPEIVAVRKLLDGLKALDALADDAARQRVADYVLARSGWAVTR